MSLFDMCCPKKPKKSLDYVIKWVEDADKTIKDLSDTVSKLSKWKEDVDESIAGFGVAIPELQGDVKDLKDWRTVIESDIDDRITEAIEGYDWSVLPEEALNAKADKVQEATEGNFASLDSYGNLLDSGYKASSFAPTEHYHRSLRLASSLYPTEYNYISLDEIEQQGRIYISLYDAETGDSAFSDYITADKLNNTFYPVTNPIANSTKLITSGGVERALKNKTSISHEDMDSIVEVEVKHVGDDEYDQAKVIGKNRIVLGVGTDAEDGSVIVDANNITNLQRALEDPAPSESGGNQLITNGQVWNAVADRAYAETFNQRKQYIIGLSLVKGTTLADYTIEHIDNPVMQSYISEIAEIGKGRIDHLVVTLKDGTTEYYLLSTVEVSDPHLIVLYIGDIVVEISRINTQSAWELKGVTKISTLF